MYAFLYAMEYTSIRVLTDTRDSLLKLKRELGFDSLDSLLKWFLMKEITKKK